MSRLHRGLALFLGQRQTRPGAFENNMPIYCASGFGCNVVLGMSRQQLGSRGEAQGRLDS